MSFITEIRKKFNNYIYDSTIELRDRTFVIFSLTMIAELLLGAIPLGFIMKEPLSSALSTLGGAFVFGIYVIYSIKKNRLKRAKIVISFILTLVFLPLMFFTNGGVYSGIPVYMLLGGIYINMILEGKFQLVMNILFSVIMTICWTVSYFKPDLILEYTRKEIYIDSLGALLTVNAVIFVLLSFYNKLYIRESENSEKKSRELEELNKSQSRFFSSMSHEIRTPINTVLGLNEIILRQEDASEEIKKDARNIQGAGKLLLALINDILDISKIEAGKMDVVPVDYDVKSLLSEIVNMIWLKAQEKGLEFKVGIDPNVPQKLYGDEVRIKQILINLLNNAVKYTPEGFISLYMECDYLGDDKVMLKINVSDSGMGIKADALPHLFDTFQRQDEEKNRYIEGTGLGLSIVKQLVELMNGKIHVDSVYTQGTTFFVEVRQGISSEDKVGDINVFSSGALSGDEKFEHGFHSPEGKILIVDDNEMNLTVEKKLLDGTELTVDLAISGSEALSKTVHEKYDVIFMDHLMPGMDGIECYEMIRSQAGGLNQRTPIIVLTANAGGENIELYNNTGFDGYLVKPVSGKQLEDMLISFIPPEKIILSHSDDTATSSMSTASGYIKKRQITIATNNLIDIPESIIRAAQISTIPFKIITDESVFYDNIDVDSDELLRYMEGGRRSAVSVVPSKEELTQFFAGELKKAHHVIYLAFASASDEYSKVLDAATTFENVTVVNSMRNSTGTGVLAMLAARMAQQNVPVPDIVRAIDDANKKLQSLCTVKSTEFLAMRGFVSKTANAILNTLWLRPILVMKNDRFRVLEFLFGNDRKCYAKLVKRALTKNVDPDPGFVFITYAGMDEEDLSWIEDKVRSYVPFERVFLQKASAGTISNTGPGTVGLTFLEKDDRNRNLLALLPKADDPVDEISDDETAEEDNAIIEDDENGSEEVTESGEPKELKWYEKIPEMDSAAAIKNSGSEEAFLQVIKIFYDSYPAKSKELQDFYDSGDFENYTVKIHALKSSARLVGFMSLGEDAEKLEMAGKGGDIEYIRVNHLPAMEKYKSIKDSLSGELGPKEDPNLPEIDTAALSELYEGLSEFSFAKDLELSRMVLESAKEYRLPKEDAERFERIQAKVELMDWEGIREIIAEVK